MLLKCIRSLKLISSLEVDILFVRRNSPTLARAASCFQVSSSHTMPHYSRQDSSGREIGQSHRRLYDNAQHSRETDNHSPEVFFLYSLVLCLYFIPTCFCVLILLHLPFCLLRTTHNTNTHAPGGIRTRNPSKRSAAVLRLRPLGHWNHISTHK